MFQYLIYFSTLSKKHANKNSHIMQIYCWQQVSFLYNRTVDSIWLAELVITMSG